MRVRAAYPFYRQGTAVQTRWACLLECGHTIELTLEAGVRPRRLDCPQCAEATESPPCDGVETVETDEIFFDFGE